MTGMRQKWDEWHRNDGMRPSLRQPNFHLIQLILMSFVSFWHHPIAVYNGDDSLMTPKWGPRQDRSWQLSLRKVPQNGLFMVSLSLTIKGPFPYVLYRNGLFSDQELKLVQLCQGAFIGMVWTWRNQLSRVLKRIQFGFPQSDYPWHKGPSSTTIGEDEQDQMSSWHLSYYFYQHQVI